METNNNPLVSIPVITYNSSKTVLETLESIKAQTYQNIELIISDDRSTDDTVAICKQWMSENTNRFARIVVLESPINKGVSANANRAEEECKGEWVKGIAGDDILFPECIFSFISYVMQHDSASFVFSRAKGFSDYDGKRNWFNTDHLYEFFSWADDEQKQFLLQVGNCLPASTFFYNKDKMRTLGVRNDERIPLLEDYPKWINILSKGGHFDFIDKELVGYRYHSSSLSTSKVRPPMSFKSECLFNHYYLAGYRDINKIVDVETQWYQNAYDSYIGECKKRQQVLNSKEYRIGYYMLKPFRIIMNLLYLIKKKR